MAETAQPLPVETVAENPTLLWGMTSTERVRRIAGAAGFGTDAAPHDGPRLLVNAAFAFDPTWLRELAGSPGAMLTLGGVPAIAHARSTDEADAVRMAMRNGTGVTGTALQVTAFEDGPTVENKALRKRETPFLIPLRPDTVRALERASYFGAYKGVTDVLTKYLWPEWALVLTRICARFGITPNMVTAVGAILCVAATFAFAQGQYWLGMAMGLGFMVLDTVDGKLARCTITSSWWGNVFDHGMDLVHPPFWWWFWAIGLAHWGLAYDTATFWWVQGVIQGGYIVQRLIEGIFMRQNAGMHIHVWRRFDSRFRLITARRNPNMVILFVSMLFARPDIGLVAVAWWTAISCAVHAVRLVQAWVRRAQSGAITSWLAEGAA
jgi:phosphatidylglycerophosphate synthase